MDERAWLVAGGFTTFAASVAVIGAVALSNSVALADSAGANVASARVLVPAAAGTASSSGTAHGSDEVPPVRLSRTPQAEVVEAPAPVVVDASDGDVTPSEDSVPETPAAPEAPTAPTAPAASVPAAPADAESAAVAARASGSWDDARRWALSQGWPAARVEAWIERLESWQEPRTDDAQKSRGDEKSVSSGDSAKKQADTAGTSSTASAMSRDSHNRPAHAGSPHDRRWYDGGQGAKKDRSRESPD